MANAIELEKSDSLEQRLYIALGKEDATPLRDLLRTTTQVAIAELKAQLNADAQSALGTLHRYCTRWDAMGGPPLKMAIPLPDPVPDEPYDSMRECERERRDPNAYHPLIEFDRSWRPWRYEPAPSLPPLPPPPAWDAQSVESLRGALRGALKQLMAGDPSLPRRPGNNQVPPAAKPEIRVSYHDAIEGRPDLNLPRTARNTLVAWCRNPQTAADLGVNPKGKVAAQQPLVEGLLRLHAQKSTKRQPPQSRRR